MKGSVRIKGSAVAAVMLCVVFACAQGASAQDAKKNHEPPALGKHWAKGSLHQHGGGSSPNMLWHSGAILTSATVQVIYWGPSWSNSTFVQDKITGLESWYTGFTGSNYAKTSDEYTGTNGQVGSSESYVGYFIDTNTASSGGSTSAILAEVCKAIPNPVANGYYPVYVDLKRGNAGYCAYHSYGTCGTTPVQFAFFWDLDGDAGCDPQSTVSGESQGLAALANVSGHELSEARTDPRNGGWYDNSGSENGDKCAWTFNVPYVTFPNGSKWKIQGEWSNNAYNKGTGYPNLSGQKGCLSGQ